MASSAKQYVNPSFKGFQDGTQDQPWRSLQPAVEYFRNSPYNNVHINVSGDVPLGQQILKLHKICDARIEFYACNDDWSRMVNDKILIESDSTPMIDHDGGDYLFWHFNMGNYTRKSAGQNAYVGSGTNATMDFNECNFRTGSQSGTITAERGARVNIGGTTLINPEAYDAPIANMRYSFAGLTATSGGHIRCSNKKDRLVMGNGAASASLGGIIEFGWPEVFINNYTGNNLLSGNDFALLMLRGSEFTLNARADSNTVIGFEVGCQCMAEDAWVRILSHDHDQSIALQKWSHVSWGGGGVVAVGDKGLRIGATQTSGMMIPLKFEEGGHIKDFFADMGAQIFASGDIPSGYRVNQGRLGEVVVNDVKHQSVSPMGAIQDDHHEVQGCCEKQFRMWRDKSDCYGYLDPVQPTGAT